MLPSRNRVKRGESKKSASKRRVFRGSFITISTASYLSPDHKYTAKVSVVVSRNAIKSAVSRNHTKRRVYSAIREHLADMNPGIYMVYVKKESKNASYKELKEDIKNVLKKTQ